MTRAGMEDRAEGEDMVDPLVLSMVCAEGGAAEGAES
jgi:hypothetical protein